MPTHMQIFQVEIEERMRAYKMRSHKLRRESPLWQYVGWRECESHKATKQVKKSNEK